MDVVTSGLALIVVPSWQHTHMAFWLAVGQSCVVACITAYYYNCCCHQPSTTYLCLCFVAHALMTDLPRLALCLTISLCLGFVGDQDDRIYFLNPVADQCDRASSLLL